MKKNRLGKTLFVYLLSEILLYCFVAFLFFFVIFFVNNLLVNIQDNLIKNVSLRLIAKFFLYSIPIVIANAAPYSAFVGALMCLGRFVSDLEFVSMNSLGISDKKLLFPVMSAALIFCVLNFFVNDLLIPLTAPKLNDIYVEMVSENPATQMQSFAIKKTDKIIIACGEISKDGINDILVVDNSVQGQTNLLSAKRAQLVKQNNKEILMSIVPEHPRLLVLQDNNPANFEYAFGEKLTYNFLLSEMQNLNFFSLGPGQLNFYTLLKKIEAIKQDGATSPEYINWYKLELHKKLSVPFGALFFVFLAYALSCNLKIYNQGVGFVTGLLISVAYWAVLMGGQQLGIKKNINSALVAWLPNVLLLLTASFLMWKKSRK